MTPAAPHVAATQAKASDPRASAWVDANAGSGKTHVLTMRVIRLLLDGVEPSKILCLTFTKAAAATVAARVFDRLGDWTRLDDAALSREIALIEGEAAPRRIDLARRLFARAIETPGGLKIQTIHAFCERVLHQFPFEANLPAGSSLVEDEAAAELVREARESVLAEAARAPRSDLARALETVSIEASEFGFDALIDEALGERAAIVALAQAGARDRNGLVGRLNRVLGLAPETTLGAVERRFVEEGIPSSEWPAVAAALDRGSKQDQRLADALRVAAAAKGADQVDAYFSVFFTDEGGPRASLATKGLQQKEPGLLARLEAEQARLETLAEPRRAAAAARRTAALVAVMSAILARYATLKIESALLDYEDLIERVGALLKQTGAGWVLYKLDAGVDHILVDEAQDTSPAQWAILRAIAEDFTAGEGAVSRTRTFFAVGDEKQSIFSFQGADPRSFDDMRHHFKDKVEAAQLAFHDLRLTTSFRSAPGVLDAVDAVFAIEAHRRGLQAQDAPTVHEAHKRDLPSLIELWDALPPRPTTEPRDWRLPVDAPDAHDPPSALARRIAGLMKRWLSPHSPERVRDKASEAPRPIRAGDVMILVRRRDSLFEALIRALKEAGVPVAGADRLKLADHIAVADLLAAGRAALQPDDDFSLACVLKSPLVGLDDDDLMTLAHDRAGSLAAALAQSSEPRHARAAAILARWRERARRCGAGDFYAHLLSADGGRRDLVARLGAEAGDAIDEFLALALAREASAPPSLLGFITAFETSSAEVKRDMEAEGDRVRVMTAHAAKGLEAKIVLLPDTCALPSPTHAPKLFPLKDDGLGAALVWSARKELDCAAAARAREAARLAAEDEYRRLLYVAMTRAEERLYVMGWHGERGRAQQSWHAMIETALDGRCVEEPAPWSAEERVRRWRSGAHAVSEAAAPEPPPSIELPAWLREPAPSETAPAPMRPSGDASGAPDPERARFGALMHALLQYLPDVAAADRLDRARAFLERRGAELDAGARATLARQAVGVIEDSAATPLFAPGSLAEVDIEGAVALDGRVVLARGRIDRLAVSEGIVRIADFKTGAGASAPTPAHARQLALYRAALAPLYPEHAIRAFLVFTAGPRIVAVDDATLELALYLEKNT